MCVCGCRSAVHFDDNREDLGVRNEEHDGGGRQENQSGGSAVELTAGSDHLRGGEGGGLFDLLGSSLYLFSTHLH